MFVPDGAQERLLFEMFANCDINDWLTVYVTKRAFLRQRYAAEPTQRHADNKQHSSDTGKSLRACVLLYVLTLSWRFHARLNSNLMLVVWKPIIVKGILLFKPQKIFRYQGTLLTSVIGNFLWWTVASGPRQIFPH